MKAVVQRVSSAQVSIGGKVYSRIGRGLLVLLGVMEGDSSAEGKLLADKLTGLRIFTDDQGKMNLSLADVDGEVLVVSNFTLGADCRKGRRPSFTNSAAPEPAKALYEEFLSYVGSLTGKPCAHGEFGAKMAVALVNDGPVTLLLDTDQLGPKGKE